MENQFLDKEQEKLNIITKECGIQCFEVFKKNRIVSISDMITIMTALFANSIKTFEDLAGSKFLKVILDQLSKEEE